VSSQHNPTARSPLFLCWWLFFSVRR
jgi:hypothetical protein